MDPTNSGPRLEDFEHFVHGTQKKAKTLITKITHSGETEPIKEDLVELKKICKASSDDFMIVVYRHCLKCLRKEHSQVRAATVKLMDYLFTKSHVFRLKLLDDFDIFLELTLAITQKPKVKLKLPPPKKYANLLQELSAKAIHRWNSDFSRGYEKLRYAYKFLREHKLVDFNRFQVTNHEEMLKQQRLAEQREKVLTRSIENRLKEFRELKPELEHLLVQIESLIDILVPCDDNFLRTNDTNESNVEERYFGMVPNMHQDISIEFSPFIEVKNADENKDAIASLKELKQELVKGKLVRLVAIEKTISKRSDKLLDILKEIIDIKSRATNLIVKLVELKIVNENESRETGDDESDDEDDDTFQDVEPKEDIESYIPKSMRYEYGLEPIDPKELEDQNRVTFSGEIFETSDSMPGTSTSSNGLNQKGPVLSCNVLLDSGKLCPRRDKVKCPFHGKIIPRDTFGMPIDENLRLLEEQKVKKAKSNIPDWQDPQLLADINAATGIDLTMPSRRGKSNRLSPKKKLANPKTCDLTPKKRLQMKLRKLAR
uniref:Uncharacterized protein KIAA1530 n=1 Tax=Aceria tosichella TaxID=561515 RepID=A0A6G1S953_9ACAR